MLLCGLTLLEGFVIGTALAPTSAGMTVKLMSDAGVLQSEVGQMIVHSARTDDVLSLIILAIEEAMAPFDPIDRAGDD